MTVRARVSGFNVLPISPLEQLSEVNVSDLYLHPLGQPQPLDPQTKPRKKLTFG